MPAVPLYKIKSLANAHTFAAVSPTIALARVQVDRGIHRANPDWGALANNQAIIFEGTTSGLLSTLASSENPVG